MITQHLLDYINQEIQLGVTPNAIKDVLRSNGWIETDIDLAFINVKPPTAVTPTIKTAYIIPSQRKYPVKMIVIITVLVIILGGMIYTGFVLTATPSLEVTSPTTTTTNSTPEPLPVALSSPKNILGFSTTTATTSIPLSIVSNPTQGTTTPSTVLDCGSVSTVRMNSLNGVSAMSNQDRASLACASNAFTTCSPMTLMYTTISTTSVSILTINGLTDSYCSMTMISSVSPIKPTCKVPMDLLAQVVESAQKSKQGDLFSYPVVSAGLFFMGTPLTKTRTGEIVTIECTQN